MKDKVKCEFNNKGKLNQSNYHLFHLKLFVFQIVCFSKLQLAFKSWFWFTWGFYFATGRDFSSSWFEEDQSWVPDPFDWFCWPSLFYLVYRYLPKPLELFLLGCSCCFPPSPSSFLKSDISSQRPHAVFALLFLSQHFVEWLPLDLCWQLYNDKRICVQANMW